MAIKDLSQVRAYFAFKKVSQACQEMTPDVRKEFKSHIMDVPMMIKTNGLAAAYAFIFAKGKRASGDSGKKDYLFIEDITREWLVAEQQIFSVASGEEFYKALIATSPDQYKRSIRELLALFTWLKRFAEGMIE